MHKQIIYIAITALVCFVIGWFGVVYRAGNNSQRKTSLQQKSQSATISNDTTSTTQAYLLSGDRCLELAVADTPQERRQGLSGYRNLSSDAGMLFVYGQASEYGFWMKRMDFPIDILWLTSENRVVGIKRNAQPDSFPQTFYPEQPAKKVIETPAGFARKQNINFGDYLNVTGPTTTSPGGC